MAWTLNNQTLESRGVDDLSLSLRTQAASQMHFNVVANFDAAAAFAYDAAVTLRYGSTIVFQGTCDPVVRAASAQSEGHAYHVSDAWQKLEETIYQERWAQSGVSGGTLLPMVVLGMSASGAWEKIGKTIEGVINFAAACGINIAVGTIALGDELWPTEVENMSCAEVIRKSLKFYPSYVTWIDYSASPPTFNVTAAAAMTTVTLSLASNGTIQSLRHRRCPELLPDGVRLVFKTAQILNGVTLRKVVVAKWPTSSADSGPRILTNTTELQGMKEQLKKTQIQTRPIPVSGESSLTEAKAYLKLKFPHLNVIPDAAFNVTKWEKTIVPEPAEDHAPEVNPNLLRKRGTDLESHLPNELVRGHITPGSLKHVGKVHVEFEVVFTTAGSPTDEQKAAMAKPLPPGFTVVATDATTKIFTTIEQFELGDTAPTGLAKVIYEQIHAAYPCEGTIGLVATEPSLARYLGKKISVTDLTDAIGTMTAIVHSVDFEIQSGKTEIGYGPAPHLMAADFLEMQRLIRTRPISTFSFDERTSERLGSESKAGSKGDSVQPYDVPETVYDPIPQPLEQFDVSVIASGAAWKAKSTPGWVRFSDSVPGGDAVGYWLPATLGDDPAPTWTVSESLALYVLVATDSDGLPTAVTMTTAANDVASTHYQPPLPDTGASGVNGAYYYKLSEFEMDGFVLKPKQFQTGGPIVHVAELWKGKNIGDGDYKIFKKRNNATKEYYIRRLKQLYEADNSRLIKPVATVPGDDIEFVSVYGRFGLTDANSADGAQLILDVDAENIGSEGCEIYKPPTLTAGVPGDVKLQLRKVRGLSSTEAAAEGISPQIEFTVVGDTVLGRGNKKKAALIVKAYSGTELGRIAWQDGLVTDATDVTVTLPDPSAGSTGENHPWKVTATAGTANSWDYVGGDVYGQGGTITVGSGTKTAVSAGYIYLQITRNSASRVITAVSVLTGSTVPASTNSYQYRALAYVTSGSPVLQLQFEEIRIEELLIVTNGAFQLAAMEMASRNTYDPPT